MGQEQRKASVIIQARMSSTRLPGKVMKDILGKPLLSFLLERLKQCQTIERVIIATTDSPKDKVIVEYAKNRGVAVFCGSENDVLDRYYQTAKVHQLDTIVRVTSDCPLLDPDVTDSVVKYFYEHANLDLVNTGQSYPEGFDTEVFSFTSLEKAWQAARLRSEREHVTSYIWNNRDQFKTKTLEYVRDLSFLRFSVDEEADYEVVKLIMERLYRPGQLFKLADILKLYEQEPAIFKKNINIVRNEGYLKSIAND